MDNDKVKLYEFILDQYSLSELKDLCFYLDVTYDDLEGGARKDKARELVEHMTRRKRLDDLRAVLNQQRPDAYRGEFATTPATPVAAPNSTTTRRNPRQIFISHATADSAFAHRLAADLQRDGFDIWIAPESIRPGEQWVRAINRGLEESGVMVLVLTPAAVASPWVEMETNVAIELERSQEAAFIPLLREKGRYPGLWRAYQWVMMDGEYAAGLAALRARLSGAASVDAQVEWVKSLPDKVFPAKVSQLPPTNPDRRIHEKTGIELVRIPAGPFLYGDDKRTIELPEFWIGRTPVTNAQYKRFVDAIGYAAPYGWTGKNPPPNKRDHPVVNVTWYDAIAFCDWAGLTLPSEEEWEKAARGIDGRIWPWGDNWISNIANTSEAGIEATTQVGYYSPEGDSPLGCVDMTGNVWEWTDTPFFIWNLKNQVTLRGGSWGSNYLDTRNPVKNYDKPDVVDSRFGFRVVIPDVSESVTIDSLRDIARRSNRLSEYLKLVR